MVLTNDSIIEQVEWQVSCQKSFCNLMLQRSDIVEHLEFLDNPFS